MIARSLFILTVLLAVAAAQAAPIVPASDDQVVEKLPGGRDSAETRKQRLVLAQRPKDAELAVALARRLLERSRAEGDPRYAGRALAALHPWQAASDAPDAVLLMQATLQQHLHDFDGAALRLEALVLRAPQLAQAWLTLATVRRVQGRYAASDAACAGLARAEGGIGLYGQACQAENDGLRGHFDRAGVRLHRLAATPQLDVDTRAWLLGSLAELQERAGQVAASEASRRAALRLVKQDAYATIAYADFLILQGRGAEALPSLEALPRSDAVLLRIAVVAGPTGERGSEAAREMRERLALVQQRPQSPAAHAREQAMFALWVDKDAKRALEWARRNVELQREPIDLLLWAQAAHAAGQGDALRQARALAREIGLRDLRIDAIG